MFKIVFSILVYWRIKRYILVYLQNKTKFNYLKKNWKKSAWNMATSIEEPIQKCLEQPIQLANCMWLWKIPEWSHSASCMYVVWETHDKWGPSPNILPLSTENKYWCYTCWVTWVKMTHERFQVGDATHLIKEN